MQRRNKFSFYLSFTAHHSNTHLCCITAQMGVRFLWYAYTGFKRIRQIVGGMFQS